MSYNMVSNLTSKNSDLSLTAWRVNNYQKGKLGQLNISSGRLLEVVDKNLNCKFKYAWGAIGWNKSLNSLISNKDPHIGYIINPAIKINHKISINYAKKQIL